MTISDCKASKLVFKKDGETEMYSLYDLIVEEIRYYFFEDYRLNIDHFFHCQNSKINAYWYMFQALSSMHYEWTNEDGRDHDAEDFLIFEAFEMMNVLTDEIIKVYKPIKGITMFYDGVEIKGGTDGRH